MLLEESERKSVLVVDDPDEEESVLLEFLERQVHDFLIGECVIGNCYTAGGVCT